MLKTTETVSKKDNKIYKDTRFFIVAGGVSQEMNVSNKNLYYTKKLDGAGKMIIKAKPNKNALIWKVVLDK